MVESGHWPSVGLMGQLRPAPRTVRNDDHAPASVVDHDAVGLIVGPEVYQAVGTIMTVGVLLAGRVHIARHHFAAVLGHLVTNTALANVRNGWKADKGWPG
jgi:hypothetical protein